MRVGIMSMQRICNYGSFLQAYCLKKMIESLGHQVEFVDYKPGKPVLGGDYTQAMYLKSLVREGVMAAAVELEPLCFFAPERVRRPLRFKRDYQKKYLPLLGVGGKNRGRGVDTLVIGSDEVFNCFQKNPQVGFSRDLFGKGHPGKRLISYAASFGNTTLEELRRAELDGELATLLGGFDALSVRDANSESIVAGLTGEKPFVHMDPVLMYDFSADVPDTEKPGKYLAVYAYRGRISEAESRAITAFARERGLQTVSVGGVQPFCDLYAQGSPLEIIDWVRKAEYVVTDTFHGTVFSVINHKKFVTFVRSGHGKSYGNREKLTDLIGRLGLDSRAVPDSTDFAAVLEQPIDYGPVDGIIAAQRQQAMDYLRRSLG